MGRLQLSERQAVGTARRQRRRARASTLALGLGLLVAGGCSDDSSEDQAPPAPQTGKAVVEDPGPVHVHGLGVNPADGKLVVATHTGLFEVLGPRKAGRIAGRYQDTMAFQVTGPDRFIGSGHPDVRENLPPFLGFIESDDAGKTWRPRSLQGRVDFHVLRAVGARVYGFGTDFESRAPKFLVSRDRGRTWTRREVPEALESLAVNPSNPRHLVASGRAGLHVSRDEGRTWRDLRSEPGLLAWAAPGRLYVLDHEGMVAVSSSGGRRWQATGSVGGRPAAFEVARGRLLAALHDGTVKVSDNQGSTWRVRFRPKSETRPVEP